ncbi:MAG: carboxy-S-adenosyl-L-methionine synthase CmoA [Deltaproteobacteria bacterium]|nr:carboxy-S-adenosyl-L-methionine synthase CmoA [Deltaproteobacteria bacterium]
MKQDNLFLTSYEQPHDFEFSAAVASVFDDMIARSVPLYTEQQRMIQEIAKHFRPQGTDVYDLGCATATTLINLCGEIHEPVRFIGYDNSLAMLEQAKLKVREKGLEDRIDLRLGDLEGGLLTQPLQNAGLVNVGWTLQFVRPVRRDRVIRWIYESLSSGGALILTEKILTRDTHTSRFFIDTYYRFKRRNGYSDDEITRKREALENVLVPYTIAENIEMLRRNGFEVAETFFQWYNFAAFLCLRTSK